MNMSKTLILLGPLEARSRAKGLLENHPQIKRVDAQNNNALLKLILFSDISAMEILSLIADAGLSGVSFR